MIVAKDPRQFPHHLPQRNIERIAMADASSTFTTTSALSIAGVFGALAFAYLGLVGLLPKSASKADRVAFVWLVSQSGSNPETIRVVRND